MGHECLTCQRSKCRRCAAEARTDSSRSIQHRAALQRQKKGEEKLDNYL